MSSKIEWTGETWNPVLGCTKVSGGCDNCYAMGAAWMKQHHPNAKIQAAYAGLTVKRNGRAAWTNQVRCLPERLAIPLGWKKPRTIFVNSMSDLFHEGVPDEFVDQVFAVMALTPQHTYQILTKRPERAAAYMATAHAAGPGGSYCPRKNHVMNIADTMARKKHPKAFAAAAMMIALDTVGSRGCPINCMPATVVMA